MTSKRWVVLCSTIGVLLVASASLALTRAQATSVLRPAKPQPVPKMASVSAEALQEEPSARIAPLAEHASSLSRAAATSSATPFRPTFYATQDTFVQHGSASTNYGSADYLRSGRDLTPDEFQTLVQFDVSELPDNALVVSATLALYSPSAATARPPPP